MVGKHRPSRAGVSSQVEYKRMNGCLDTGNVDKAFEEVVTKIGDGQGVSIPYNLSGQPEAVDADLNEVRIISVV